MKVGIKRIDSTLPLPKYETNGSVGFDFLCRVETVIGAGEIALIPGNLIVETPPGYMLAVCARSSTPKRKGLLIPHGLGVVDNDYCGPEDEIIIQVYNFTNKEVIVERGEKIAQGIFVKIDVTEWEEKEPGQASRGGFGSTQNE